MASMTPWKDGKFRVSWRDGIGIQHNKYLLKPAATTLYKQVCAQQLFEDSGISQSLGIKATTNIRKLKLKDLANRYVTEYLIPQTRAASNEYFVRILNYKWGDYPISMLNPAEFKKWILFALTNPIPTPWRDGWRKSQLAASSVRKLVRYMTRIFYWSMQEGIINHNPFANIIPKKDPINKVFRRQSKFKPIALTLDEFWPMAESFDSFLRYAAITCFFSGIRRGELSQIRWSKINRKEKRFEFEADELKEADAKNVYYDAEVEPVLEALEIDYITNGYNDDIVFRNRKGEVLSDDLFTHEIRLQSDKFAVLTGNKKYHKVTPHTFRRSYRTRKDREGADRKAVCANMGHHSEATSELYNLMDEDRQRTVAGNLKKCPDVIVKSIIPAVETARSEGLELSDLQSELRKAWKSVCYSVLRQ